MHAGSSDLLVSKSSLIASSSLCKVQFFTSQWHVKTKVARQEETYNKAVQP